VETEGSPPPRFVVPAPFQKHRTPNRVGRMTERRRWALTSGADINGPATTPTTSVRIGALALLLVYVVMAASAVILRINVEGVTPLVVAPVLFAASPAMGALILLRAGSHRIGWMLELIGILLLLMTSSGDYAAYALVLHPGSLPFGNVAVILDGSIWVIGLFLFGVMLPLTFPSGHLMSNRWLIPIVLSLLYFALVVPGNAFLPGHPVGGYPQISNPIGWPGHADLMNALQTFSLLPGIGWVVGVVAAVIVRFRRSLGVERQQLKWFMFSFLLLPVGLALNGVPVLDILSIVIIQLAIPTSIALAVLRHRLYDIDVVISRTLVYGSLAVFITAVYVGIAVGIGAAIGGGGRPNLGLSILATAIVAVGFQPLRERLQKVANRFVYGKRATPYEVLSQFSERVAESYAVDEVMPRMARVLADGTGAQRADVWLRSDQSLRPAAAWPADAPLLDPVPLTGGDLPVAEGADRMVAVRHQGELLGALSLTKRAGEVLTPVEENLLAHLAGQAGLVLKNVGLTADLQARLTELRASRQRLVSAQDEERRRLERNLHDGAQQHLVALKVKLGLAEMMADRDPAKARATIMQLKADADEALETLRDLARGIYPPLLADKGLAAALESQARKATVPVTVDAVGVGRYPQEIEAAVYFCCLEALQNLQKYARAEHAIIRLRDEEGRLRFEVVDDGIGFDPATTTKGSGLDNMIDRLDALGGDMQFIASPGKGTRLCGSLPVEARVPDGKNLVITSGVR
jgi:signal transduction histidine kinase